MKRKLKGSYCVFLRSANVGGSGMIKMDAYDLKKKMKSNGFDDVKTYIQVNYHHLLLLVI